MRRSCGGVGLASAVGVKDSGHDEEKPGYSMIIGVNGVEK